MKKLLLLALATLLTFGVANAFDNEYIMHFGDPAGLPITVTLDSDLDIPVYLTQDAAGTHTGNACQIMLASDDVFITARTGVTLAPDYVPPNWNLWGFDLGPDPVLGGGFTTEVAAGLGTLTDPHPEYWWNWPGEQRLIMTFHMHTTADAIYEETTQCPLLGGYWDIPVLAGQYIGTTDGVGHTFGEDLGINGDFQLETHYSCLYFTGNSDPVWTTTFPTPVPATAFVPVDIFLAGTDADVDNDLQIYLVAGGGTYTPAVSGPGGNASGTYENTFTTPGINAVDFILTDGTVDVPMTVEFDVAETPILEIGCPLAAPGEVAVVPVKLYTATFLTGGFEILFQYDPTALHLMQVIPTWRINNGSEFFEVTADAEGPGTCRVVWIADIPNGTPESPCQPGTGNILRLEFMVDAGLPFGIMTPIEFIESADDIFANTISDSTGNILVWPDLYAGCVNVSDPAEFKGDPNVNCYLYEVADAVLVARRLAYGFGVWADNETNCYGLPPFTGDDDFQENSADLNNNTFVDVADLVQFINIINGDMAPPRPNPEATGVDISMPSAIEDNMVISISSGMDVGAARVVINHDGVELGVPTANGMDVVYHDADGVMTVVVYSLEGNTIAAGNATLVTIPVTGEGSMDFAEVSVSDSYGRLLDASASLVAPLPTQFAVTGNYPNPFNANTKISFDLPSGNDVNIAIYSITGQLVESISGHFEAGSHSVDWDASDVSSGVYFYKVSAGDHSQTQKMTLLK